MMDLHDDDLIRVLREEIGGPSELTEGGRAVARELIVLPD